MGFEYQIQYLISKYNVLTPGEVRDVVKDGRHFERNDCWLTFDDGYVDDIQYVFPILEKYGLKASFFPPVLTTLAQDLDVWIRGDTASV